MLFADIQYASKLLQYTVMLCISNLLQYTVILYTSSMLQCTMIVYKCSLLQDTMILYNSTRHGDAADRCLESVTTCPAVNESQVV